MYKIIIDARAMEDLKSAKEWYNEQQKGLGKKFADKVKELISDLRKQPLGYAIRYADVRCLIVFKYPYTIHYKVKEDIKTIVIIAVFNTNRNPELWKERNESIK
jgi:plasmid stabilization system protein ParE